MTLADHLGALLDTPVRAVTDLGASHEWTTHRATLTDGREVFVKAAAEPTTVFAAEAAGLRWLATGAASGLRGSARPDSREPMMPADLRGPTGGTEFREPATQMPEPPGWDSEEPRGPVNQLGQVDQSPTQPGKPGHNRSSCIRAGLAAELSSGEAQSGSGMAGGRYGDTAVGQHTGALLPEVALLPDVLAADDRMIVLPWLDDHGATPDTADRLGRELATLHANTPTMFGAPWPGWIAELPLDNTLSAGPWPQWYAERRLAPYLPRAATHLGPDGTRLLEQVIDRIDTLAGPPEPPARIHGDLWSGNIVWTPDRAVLIDPAAHGGHRETDLAMLALFGAPHLDRIRNAYNETHPLADGWRTRIPLHQLHHLLVHVVLFGASYRAQTLTAATAALRS
ncbi:fructosamine kinase family protein [Nocardia suismassiliense]|uniref:Fructosamine kinase family protein n=1 Tax=Nocardia suismassiliense TaxID=2077092 RepID=A0ABW6QXB0_9NOCA